MINILIVEDSPTETLILKEIMESFDDLHVVACASNGKQAVALTHEYKPDIITMDINMPVMDGIEATKIIMSQCPTPIVVISSNVNSVNMNATYQALEAGALSVIAKPVGLIGHVFPKDEINRLIDTIRAMAEIKVVKRKFSLTTEAQPQPTSRKAKLKTIKYEVIAIGASVGGPQTLKSVLIKLPAKFPVPIVVVQHMTEGFIEGFVNWLSQSILLSVKLAEHGEVLQAGTVYFAPDNQHLEIKKINNKLSVNLSRNAAVDGFCPSVTVLMRSVAEHAQETAIGILLTGMGQDGASGLQALSKAGGHTIVQDKESAVIFGMAGVALSLGAVDKIVPLDTMADYLIEMTKHKNEK